MPACSKGAAGADVVTEVTCLISCGLHRQLNSWDGQPQANNSLLATLPSQGMPMTDPSMLPNALVQLSGTRAPLCVLCCDMPWRSRRLASGVVRSMVMSIGRVDASCAAHQQSCLI